jgi:hypothetical protein
MPVLDPSRLGAGKVPRVLLTGWDATYLTRQGTEVASPRYISLAPAALGF